MSHARDILRARFSAADKSCRQRRSIVTAGSPNEIGRSSASLRTFATDMLGFALTSGRLHLCGLAVEERANPEFGLLVALRHRRHQRFHQ
jgi:hypothetical protein